MPPLPALVVEAHGFDGFLSKPIDMRELVDALRHAVGNDARDAGDICGRV